MAPKSKPERHSAVNHNNEPRYVGYAQDVVGLYQDRDHGWLKKSSENIFAGVMQKDLFIFAMALGKHRDKNVEVGSISKKMDNIPVGAMSLSQKWALLSISIAETEGLLCLKDESPGYKTAEKYAHEGIQILKSRMERAGPNYPKELEVELREILGLIEE